MLPKVRILAVRDRNDLSARELVVELLLRLHWLCRAKCVRMRDGWKIRERCRGREAGPASLSVVVVESLGVMRDPPLPEV